MTDKDMTRADIEARLEKFGRTITTLRLKTEQQQAKYAAPLGKTLDAIEGKRSEVADRLQELDALDDKAWADAVAQLKSHLDDVDNGLRKALAHFA